MLTDKERFYDGIAADFDQIMNPYDLRRRLEVVFDQLLADVDLAGLRVLDAGCGTGPFSQRALARGATVVGLDLGVNLLKAARRKGVCDVVAADAARSAFADHTFDVVVSSECIEHTPSPRATIHDLVRVLRPGGRLVLTCPNRFWYWSCALANALGVRPYRGLEHWPSWSALRQWLQDAGVAIHRHVGLHLFPFVLTATHPALRMLDRAGGLLGPVYVNQCVLGVKRPALHPSESRHP
jgi:2-polyprenyl-3-methyl-5-hydroxy-6-metoxy-1,4-benzoquinol methylase